MLWELENPMYQLALVAPYFSTKNGVLFDVGCRYDVSNLFRAVAIQVTKPSALIPWHWWQN